MTAPNTARVRVLTTTERNHPMKPELNNERLAEIATMALDGGGHEDMSEGMCVMEAVSYVAGEPWSDTPECASPVIGAFMRSWNDSLPDEKRTELLRPLVPLLVGTKAEPDVENRRATMACDWLVRMYTPAWLRLAGLTAHADALAGLPEITDFENTPSIKAPIEAARRDASAARDAARDAAWAAAWAAAGAALAATVAELQTSALDLVKRMIECQ